MLPLDTEDRKPVLSDASSTIPKDPDSDDECKPSISCKTEVSVPPMDLLQHELQLKEEDYKKLDKMKNVSSLFHSPSQKVFIGTLFICHFSRRLRKPGT